MSWEVKDYQFSSFETNPSVDGEVKEYQIEELSKFKEKIHQKLIPQLRVEKENAREKSFKINPIVKNHRGISQVEANEYDELVRAQVEKKIEEIKKEAYSEGFNQGLIDGTQKAVTEELTHVEEKLGRLDSMLNDLSKGSAKIVEKQKQDILRLVNNLTKWIILRELKDDGAYIERLLEKIILELNAKENLLLRVNKDVFKEMPEILERLEAKLGELTNCRVEIHDSEDDPGAEVESEKGILVGTLEAQFDHLQEKFIKLMDEDAT